MDIWSIKTFLTLAEVKRLSLCAEMLCLTKSAVSSRIKQLEMQLDQQLFERSAQGMLLTNAGQRFYQHAIAMQQRWERAKKEIKQSEDASGLIRLGAHPSLASDLLLEWGSLLNQRYANLTIHLEADYSSEIVRQVAAGALDLGLIFVADATTGLIVEQVFEYQLVMVSSSATSLQQVRSEDYLYLDWGWGYNAAHSERLPQLQNSRLSCGLAELGLPWLQKNGGTAYLPERIAAPLLDSGKLFRVEDAPLFKRPIFATYASDPLDQALLEHALDALADMEVKA
ncbi:MAG: LysR family transcriptional regulator [Amphritea sp.]